MKMKMLLLKKGERTLIRKIAAKQKRILEELLYEELSEEDYERLQKNELNFEDIKGMVEKTYHKFSEIYENPYILFELAEDDLKTVRHIMFKMINNPIHDEAKKVIWHRLNIRENKYLQEN